MMLRITQFAALLASLLLLWAGVALVGTSGASGALPPGLKSPGHTSAAGPKKPEAEQQAALTGGSAAQKCRPAYRPHYGPAIQC